QAPFLVCNPDDASFPFYLYAEGSGSRVQHEEGFAKSADLINWTFVGPSHVTLTYGGWSSFERVVRDGVNSWHSTGLQAFFPGANAFGRGKCTSSNATSFAPSGSLLNVCIPVNSSGTTGATPCPDSPARQANLGAAPDSLSVSGQTWQAGRLDTIIATNRSG